jgi:uncharacterized protein
VDDVDRRYGVLVDAKRFGPWAVVTGASSGIGREFARQLAAAGINVVLVSRRGPVLEQVGATLQRQFGVSYRVIEADLSLEQGTRAVAEGTSDLDVGLLVSNAGAGQPGNFLSFEEADLRSVSQLNAISYMVLTHHFGRRLASRGKGGVLLISALGGDSGVPYNASSAATKGMVNALGRSLHYEFEALGLNLTVLVVTPTDTPIVEKMGLSAADMPIKPMPVERCVSEGLAGLNANRLMVMPGRVYRIMNALMPHGLSRRMTAAMMLKSRTFVA